MEKWQINKILSVLLLAIIISFFGFFIFKGPSLTGIVIYEETINTLNWTFDSLDDFSYDHSLINLSDGEVKLVKEIVEYTWDVEDLTDIYVISAEEYELGKTIKDETSKIQSLDGDSVNINGDKDIFDITFDSELNNNDMISIYIAESEDDDESVNTNIYLCNNAIFCDEPGYGLVNFNGIEGWYNITLSGLDEPRDIFNINPSENINFDYIKAMHIDITTHSSENISYPESASIETNDFNIISLSSFLNFHKNDLLNNQDISYYYSTDSGDSWNAMPSDNDLSDVSVNNGKLKIKAILSANGAETPIIYDFAVSYSTQTCNEDWNITYGACLSDSTQLKYYIDKNDCGTSNNLPEDNGTYETCVYDNGTISATKFVIDDKQESNVLLEVETESNIPSISISITNYSVNLKNSTPSLKELGRYLDIVADNATKQNLSSITIKIYYTDEEIANANINEETLKVHYFNETGSQWQILNSTVNASGNYVEVTIDHLSTFGIFGEENPSESSESSSSSSSGGSGRIIPKKTPETDAKPAKTETVPEVKEEKVEEPKETDNGSLIFGAVVQGELALEEKIDIKVNSSKPLSTADIIKSKIPLISILFLILVYVVYRRKRKKIPEQPKEMSSLQQSPRNL